MSSPKSAWELVELAEISNFVTSGSRGWAQYYSHVGPIFVRVGDVRRRSIKLDLHDAQHVEPPSGSEGERTKLQDGDVLVTITADLGRVGVYSESIGPAYINQHVALVRLIDSQSAEYVAWYLSSEGGQKQLREANSGTTKAGLSLDDIRSVAVPLAPLPEQQRIVAKLNALTARTAQARADLDRIPVLAARYKQAILAAAFRGQLLADWRPPPELMAAPSFRGDGIDGRAPALDSLPAQWCWTSFGQIAAVSGGLTKNPKRDQISNRVPYLRVANVYANELRLGDISTIGCTASELTKTRLQSGDLLVVEGNGSLDQIGRVAVWRGEIADCSHQNHLIRVRTHDAVGPVYALYWLLSPGGRSAIERVASSSSGLHTLSVSKITGLPIPVCSLDEQLQIVARLDVALTEIDRLAAEAAAARRLLDRLDQAILTKAFRGELIPQDPSDEPASVLLERIKAETMGAPTNRRGRKPRTKCLPAN